MVSTMKLGGGNKNGRERSEDEALRGNGTTVMKLLHAHDVQIDK